MIAGASVRYGFVDAADEQEYLDALNVCFGGWGNRDAFDWCFARPGADHLPDVLSLCVDGRRVAGSGISYRRVSVPGHADTLAGIMTGSWTLPDARGAGAFSRLVEATLERIAVREGAMLLAFVTATNKSGNQLRRAGAMQWPTFYCRGGTHGHTAAGDIVDLTDTAAAADVFGRASAHTCFRYTPAEWTAQFVSRPGDVRVLAGEHWRAVVERTPAFDRVHALAAGDRAIALRALGSRAQAENRQLFTFTTNPFEADALRSLGFTVIDGYLMAIPLRADALTDVVRWTLDNGDRM